MRKILLFSFLTFFTVQLLNAQLIISGVVDGPLTGGVPKGIEVYVSEDVPDLSIFGIGSANNGGGTDGEEFTFSGSASAGQYIYIATEVDQFTAFFGFAPTYTTGVAGINGDDAIELFKNGAVIDVFGDINVDGSNQPWEYTDGWAYRVNSTGPDGSTFVISNWTFSGKDALDNEENNQTAATPFPIGTYQLVALPAKPEPSNHVVNLMADGASITHNSFTISWEENDGETAPDGYLIVAQGLMADKKVVSIVDGNDLIDDTDLTDGEGNVKVMKGETSYTFNNCAEETDYNVSIYPYTNSNDEIDYKTNDVPSINVSTVAYVLPQGTLPYSQNFDGSLEDWSTFSVIGDQTWTTSKYGSDTFMKISGYSGGNNENEDWLISPKFNLNNYENELLSFSSAYKFSGPELQLLYSTNYDGLSNPNDYTWTDITIQATWSEGNYEWMPSGYIKLKDIEGSSVYFAFKYTSTSSASSTWEVTKVEIIEGPDNVPPLIVSVDRAPYKYPAAHEHVIVRAIVTDDDKNVSKVQLLWGNSSEDLSNTVLMNKKPYDDLYYATIPAQETGTSVYYAIKASDKLGEVTLSSAKNYTVTAWTDVASLADLRASNADGETVYRFTGKAMLTNYQAYRHKRYIQDETGAIQIDDYYNDMKTSNREGVGYTNVIGTLSEYRGMMQFTPIREATETKAPSITLQEVTINELKSNFNNYESEIIILKQVYFDDEGTFGNGKNYDIHDFSGSMVFRTEFYDVSFIGDPIPSYVSNVIGIAIEYNGAAQIAARKYTDIKDATGIDDVENSLVIRAMNRTIEINNNSGETIHTAIYNLSGKLVVEKTGNELQTRVPISKQGIYLVRITKDGVDVKAQKLLIR